MLGVITVVGHDPKTICGVCFGLMLNTFGFLSEASDCGFELKSHGNSLSCLDFGCLLLPTELEIAQE